MRPALLYAAFAALALAAPATAVAQDHACSIASSRRCHSASAMPWRHRRVVRALPHRRVVRYGQPFHVPRFSQAEAEAEVHTIYPYRTGLGPPWPDFYDTPVYPPY